MNHGWRLTDTVPDMVKLQECWHDGCHMLSGQQGMRLQRRVRYNWWTGGVGTLDKKD